MSDQHILGVDIRSEKGTASSKRLRAASFVPGVYYNAEGENITFSVAQTPLQKLFSKVGLSQVFQLEILEQGQTRRQPAIIRDVQYHPVKGTLSHVDFYGVDLTKKIHVSIPVEVRGKAKGTVFGGVLEIFRDELEVFGLPLAIPEKIVIDVTHLDINNNVHIQDLTPPPDVEFIFEDNFAVVGVSSPSSDSEPSREETAEEVAASPS
jgi:large subunit ribosomal protein L25